MEKSVNFTDIPFRWAQQEGIYKSDIRFNFVGGIEKDILRNELKIPDINEFVTTFVLSILLECESLGSITIKEPDFNNSLQSIFSFQDKNYPEDVPVKMFWPQIKNGSWFQSRPVNLVDPINVFGSIDEFLTKVLDELGLASFSKFFEGLLGDTSTMIASFRIPGDTDDTGCNLALGAILKKSGKEREAQYQMWEQNNKDIVSALELQLKYSYNPVNGTETGNGTNGVNTIDPRSYYFLRNFLKNDSSNARLILTWFSDIERDRKTIPMIAMPFHTNNVDISVSVNSLYGFTHAVLGGLNNGSVYSYFENSNHFQNLFLSTSKMVSFVINDGSLLDRPDIGLLYYPSIYDALWMTSRTVRLMQSAIFNKIKIPNTILIASQYLTEAMRTSGTEMLINLSKKTSEGVYFDDFLGNYDGKTFAEDRMFSTALAANTLMDSWSVEVWNNNTCKRKWIDRTDLSIKVLVKDILNYLQKYLLSGKYSLGNAFFSGSFKSMTTNPFSYPSNYNKFINGTSFDPHNSTLFPDIQMAYSMSGFVNETVYNQYLNETWFGNPVPTKFEGFNVKNPWPFWSSDAMSLSLSMLAYSNYHSLSQCS